MISATVLAIFFVPVFFVTVLTLVGRWFPGKTDHGHAEPAHADRRNSMRQRKMTDKTMKKRRLAPAASLALLLLGGCSFIPEYIRPASPVPEAWPTGPAYPASGAAQPVSGGPGWPIWDGRSSSAQPSSAA